jgi:acetylornithine deacetylase
LPTEAAAQALDEVQRILERQAAADPSFSGSARLLFGRPAYEVADDHVLPQTLAAAVRAIGGAPRTVGASFWADSAVLGHAGIPSVLFGPGGAGLHSTEEYVNVADVLACRDALVEMTARFCDRSR